MKKLVFSNSFSYLIFFLFIVFNNHLQATILEKMDTEKLTRKAHLIVIGKVIDIQYQWDEQWNLIFTVVTLSVEQYIKGDSKDNKIEIIYPGGNIGTKHLHVDGTPTFFKEEKVLLFLESEIKNRLRVVGWFQGKNTIINDQIVGANKSVNEFINEIKNFIKNKNL